MARGDKRHLAHSELVYREIRRAIVDGTLSPGARLVELELASTFHVSRTPVREALKRLAAEGLASADRARGMVVRAVDREEAEHIYVIRAALDGVAARLAAERITPAQISKLRVLTELMETSARDHRWDAIVQMNITFHEVLYSAAHNAPLAAIGLSLEEAVRRFSSVAFAVPERVAEVIAEHAQIVDALADHDPDRAEMLARTHMVAARANLVRHVGQGARN
jgi:DNA-binding GntR family transcriptional regulator